MLLPLRTILWGRPYDTKLLCMHLDGYAAYQRGKITGCSGCGNQLRARRAKIKSDGLGVNGTNGSTWKSIDFNAYQNCQPWLFKKKSDSLALCNDSSTKANTGTELRLAGVSLGGLCPTNNIHQFNPKQICKASEEDCGSGLTDCIIFIF